MTQESIRLFIQNAYESRLTTCNKSPWKRRHTGPEDIRLGINHYSN